MQYVQYADETKKAVVSIFSCPQDPDGYPNQDTVEDDDARYLAFVAPQPVTGGKS